MVKRVSVQWFSDHYFTFEEWRDGRVDTPYVKRICRLHSMHPNATLDQLRGHPQGGRRSLRTQNPRQVSKLSWRELTPREQDLRARGRQAISRMKNDGFSLSKAAKEVGLAPSAVIRNTNGVKKVGGMWKPKQVVWNERPMLVYCCGQALYLDITDSRHASTIGRYHNAVKEFLKTANPVHLIPFVGKFVRTSDGTMYCLETDPRSLYEITERRPEQEFYSIYRSG